MLIARRKFEMDTMLDELFPLIIAGDWRVYRGLLAIPKFARLVMRDPARWRRLLTMVIKDGKNVAWELAGRYHRDDDLPAVISADGSRRWYQHGKCHRDGDLPAVVCADGDLRWCQHGELHRDGDLPAVTYTNGGQWWYQRDKLHRDGDLPAVIWSNGYQEWWVNGVQTI